MASNTNPPDVKAYLKRLGNPYARMQIDGFQDDEAMSNIAAAIRAPRKASIKMAVMAPNERVVQADLFSEFSGRHPSDNERSGNPYKSLAQMDEDEAQSNSSLVVDQQVRLESSETATKNEFVNTCRRFFGQYVPSLERGRLRPEHRDFIDRNKGRSPTIRFRLLRELKKYDLTQIVGLQPQFNRESQSLTAQKLREIELAVGEDK